MATLPKLPSNVCAYFDCAKLVAGSPEFCYGHNGELLRKISNAKHNRRRYLSEPETRRRVIDPLLKALGWEKRRRVWEDEVPTKPPAPGAKRPSQPADYVLYAPLAHGGPSRPQLIIEAKRCRVDLDSEHEQQLLEYMQNAKVHKGALTNGFEWRFYQLKANHLDVLCRTTQVQSNEAKATMLISNLARPKPTP